MEEVEFGNLEAANRIRDDAIFGTFLAEKDKRSSKTVYLAEHTPDNALDEIVGEAADTKKEDANRYAQIELGEGEKEAIDFSQTTYVEATTIKGIAQGKGVNDWMSWFDPTLGVSEAHEVYDRAAREELGERDRGRGRDDDQEVDRRLASAHNARRAEELPQAKRYAFEGDKEAREFVEDSGTHSEVFDIQFRRQNGTVEGSGDDFDRLEEFHEERPQRAQTMDEKRQARVTRDVFDWMDAPNRWDYPGIDTVQPNELHAARSQRARTIDEKEIAPITNDKEQWAMRPDRWDYRGIDTPQSYGPTGDTPLPAEERENYSGNPPGGLASSDFESEFMGESHTPTRAGWGFSSEEDVNPAVFDQEPSGFDQEFTDDRPQQGGLTDFGMEADATMHRESRLEVEAASEFGIDDRSNAGRGVGSGDVSSQETLFSDADLDENQSGFDDLF